IEPALEIFGYLNSLVVAKGCQGKAVEVPNEVYHRVKHLEEFGLQFLRVELCHRASLHCLQLTFHCPQIQPQTTDRTSELLAFGCAVPDPDDRVFWRTPQDCTYAHFSSLSAQSAQFP